MIATNIRRLSVYLLLAFAAVSAGLSWWQVVDAQQLATRQDNPLVIAARRSAVRGSIFDANGALLASSTVVDGISRRSYVDPVLAQVIGYSSLRYGTTGVERAWDDLLTGRVDPNPLRDVVNDILARQAQPNDLTLTIDRRLQDFASSLLGANPGAVVAIDPRTGAILAMVSTPGYDATGFSGDPESAGAAWDAVAGAANNPFLDRTRQGHYTPGSIMKVVTTSAGLDSGAITPQTTFADQPRQETEGFLLDGFTIHEHDLGSVRPALWNLSNALQVSSNIFFAHVGLEIGPERYLDYAQRFGFCHQLSIGESDRSLPVDASFVSARADDGCADFADRVELANAAYGQAAVAVTPMQMALVAATIANGGIEPQPYVVRDLRAHAADPSAGPAERVLQTYGGGAGRSVISPSVASEVRIVMIDAVQGAIGRIYAGAGAVTLYGVGGVSTAGKTGTAERGPDLPPHSWFIGFAPAQPGATPVIAVGVIVEGSGGGSVLAAPIGGQVMAEWLKLLAG